MFRSIRPALFLAVLAAAALLGGVRPAAALEECRLLRQPDIQGDRIVFVYAGDLWSVARAGGVAERLTSHEGSERFPKFSPDGRTVAFTAEYDGNVDAFTIPAEGGEPVRLTWHPSDDQVAEWYPDGKTILLRSRRASAIQRFDRFFRVPAAGGFEEMLPLPSAGYATLSDDGQRIAFVSPSYDNRTWKRYRGGNAPDIWLYDFAHNTSEKITDWDGPDEWPMWHAGTVYYCSDQGGHTANIWAYDTATRARRQVTHYTDDDVKWPSVGSDAMVFEKGGYLYVMDLPGETAKQIQVLVPDDKPATRAEYKNVADWIGGWDLSPSAKRAVIEARGDIFTVPAEKGDPRNLTQSPGVRERDPAWSPDGKWIAYLSDRSGEYEIHVVPSDGAGPERQVTHGGHTFRYAPRWSADSKKVAFSDKTGSLWWCDVASGKVTQVDKTKNGEIFEYVWSGDSRWIAYTRPEDNNLSAIRLYSLASGRSTPVSSGMAEDFSPAFDPDGKYLFFLSRRTVRPEFGAFELDFQFRSTDKVYATTLRNALPSPVLPESDEETGGGDAKKGGDDAKDGSASAKGAKSVSTTPWTVDLDGIGARTTVLPISAGRYGALMAASGKVVYVAQEDQDPDAADRGDRGTGAIHVFDLSVRKDKIVLSGVDPGFALSKDGGKLLYRQKDTFGIVDVAEGKKPGDGKIASGTLMAVVDPPKEWLQMFNEAWRLERDFYYNPAMGGLDWNAVGAHYRALLPYVAHRGDLNYILGELIGELSTSHTYVGGGDMPHADHVGVGLLGADYTLDAASGRYRITHAYRDRDWNTSVQAPLGEPGVLVKDGDYLIAVNGRDVRAPENVYAAFTGTDGKLTRITVASSPSGERRTYTVTPVGGEASLRYTAWVAANRAKVAAATGGRVAYIHVPNTSIAGIQEFAKQYYPQVEKDAIIVDERWNGGGFIPDFFVERLARRTWSYWSTRDGRDFRTPSTAIDGPKCILVNHYAGSGGDAFPYYFRLAGLGPVIGTRTWGGLVGIGHSLPLVDGGSVTMPDFAFWNTQGSWDVENHGVDPDIAVENTPDAEVAGHDTQLERAIKYCMDEMTSKPVARPSRPAYRMQSKTEGAPDPR